MELFDVIKSTLRVTTTDEGIAEEIEALINASQDDLQTAGVDKSLATDINNPLTRQAIIFYCKSNFGYDNPDSARFAKLYEMLKNTLAEVGDVNAE